MYFDLDLFIADFRIDAIHEHDEEWLQEAKKLIAIKVGQSTTHEGGESDVIEIPAKIT